MWSIAATQNVEKEDFSNIFKNFSHSIQNHDVLRTRAILIIIILAIIAYL